MVSSGSKIRALELHPAWACLSCSNIIVKKLKELHFPSQMWAYNCDDHFLRWYGKGRQIKSCIRPCIIVSSFSQCLVPPRASMFIAPGEGYHMTSWSLETYVPPVTECPGKYVDRGCYFVFYARGFGEGKFTFWIELEVSIKRQRFHHLLFFETRGD